MKNIAIIFLFVWFAILTVVYGVFLESYGGRITDLEEKAKHFKCIEQRVSKYHQSFPRSGGGWFVAVDSVDIKGKSIKIIEKDGFYYCPYCGTNIDLNLAHSCITVNK